ncbi:hypothetical protein ATO67_10745 [Agrobacterium bohemicum]|uniref:Uncharacterized protein n=1 Tax=Agrobacterium bohemicum TaxID=2052828 RepID=A0A135P119_9HYPH|nr:hypothetical protein ATO67_10745 [Agrobacterium bohemicum]
MRRFCKFIWCNAIRICCIFFIIYIAVAAIDFVVTMWRVHQCPATEDLSALPPAYIKVLDLAKSDNPSDIAAAAGLLYEDKLVSDADTELGFRNLCLAEDLRRVAAKLGDENSRQWLIKFYGQKNFPIVGKQSYFNPCEAAAWRTYKSNEKLPEKGFTLTRYFYNNSCDIPNMWDGSQRIVFEAALNCINKNRA